MKTGIIRKLLIMIMAIVLLSTNSILGTVNVVNALSEDNNGEYQNTSLITTAGMDGIVSAQAASYDKYYHNVDIKDGVEKIYHHNGTATNYGNAGWCMDKGANLYGYGNPGGYGSVSGEYNAYETNNPRDSASAGSIRWLLDNILRTGNDVSDEETEYYINNLQKILGNSGNINDYIDNSKPDTVDNKNELGKYDKIHKIEQFVLWSFTDNVTPDSSIGFPTNDPLYKALKDAAENHSDYSSNGYTDVTIDASNAELKNGVVGPVKITNNKNKLILVAAKENNADIKLYTDEACTNELSKYSDINGNVYAKANSTTNVNITFRYGAYNTEAKYYTTTGNPGSYRDQSFLMLSRIITGNEVSFGNKNVNVEVHKKDMDGNDIGNIGTFKYWVTDSYGSGIVPTGEGTTMEAHKSSIQMSYGTSKYVWITETEAQKPYGLGYFEAPDGQTNYICIKVSVDKSGNVSQAYPAEPQEGYNGYLKYVKDNDKTVYLQPDSQYFGGVSSSGNTIIAAVKDPVKTGSFALQLIKEDNEGKKLSDAEFKVTIIDEKGNKVYETSEGRTEKTGSDGSLLISGLEIADEGKTFTVKIHEEKAPAGYIAGADVEFTAESIASTTEGYVLKPVDTKNVSGSEVTITNSLIKVLVKNTKKVGAFNLQLIKEDNKGTKLAGAEFEITITDKEGKVVYKTATGKTEKTDSNGLINLSNLNIESAGKVYTVKIHETKAPTGYIAGADVTFTAESQDNSAKTGYELKPVTKTGVSGSEVTITNTMITVLIKNTQKVGSYAVNLVKVDKQGHIISKEVSKFTINGEDAETSNGYLRVASAKEITKDGQIDTYKIVETEAPKGYEKYLQEIALTVVGQETSNGYAVDTRKN